MNKISLKVQYCIRPRFGREMLGGHRSGETVQCCLLQQLSQRCHLILDLRHFSCCYLKANEVIKHEMEYTCFNGS